MRMMPIISREKRVSKREALIHPRVKGVSLVGRMQQQQQQQQQQRETWVDSSRGCLRGISLCWGGLEYISCWERVQMKVSQAMFMMLIIGGHVANPDPGMFLFEWFFWQQLLTCYGSHVFVAPLSRNENRQASLNKSAVKTPKFNMEPENNGFQIVFKRTFPFSWDLFSGSMLNLRGYFKKTSELSVFISKSSHGLNRLGNLYSPSNGGPET